jgi:hypothetical protein
MKREKIDLIIVNSCDVGCIAYHEGVKEKLDKYDRKDLLAKCKALCKTLPFEVSKKMNE